MSASSERSAAISELRQQLLKNQHSGVEPQLVRTQLPQLDQLLPAHGLKTGSIVEWVSESVGLGAACVALRCAAPFLEQPGCLAVLDSHHDFNPTAAAACGIPLSRILLIRPSLTEAGNSPTATSSAPTAAPRDQKEAHVTHSRIRRASSLQADALWALEQSARCPAVRVVLCSVDRISSTATRRLQLAVERSGATVFLIRPASALKQPTFADLRLVVRHHAAGSAEQSNSRSINPPRTFPPNPARITSPPTCRHIIVELLKARSAVTQSGYATLSIDYETGLVSAVSDKPPQR